jgi:hypothetical protein
MPGRVRPAAIASALLALALAGCGLGPGAGSAGDPVTLTVTRDFGTSTLARASAKGLPSSETAMRLLERHARVQTRYGGGFVQCVNGLCGGGDGGRRVDWFYFVNGVEADKGAADTHLSGGDAVWWDHRAWDATDHVPAVVGSFPEPFLHGPGSGKRLPVRIECLHPEDQVCGDAQAALVHYDISASKTTLRSSIAQDTLRVVVGTWTVLREDGALQPLEDGPSASGVYAEPRADGRSIALLDARGRVTRTLGAGAGLVAATRTGEDPPIWALTGTDDAGVAAAVRAFSAQTLHDRYAVAVDGAARIPVPDTGRAG